MILIHSIVCTATHTATKSTRIHRVYVHAPVERYSAVDSRLSNVNRICTSRTNTFTTVVISRYHSIFGLAQHNTAAKILLLAAKSIQFVNRLRLDRIKTTNTGRIKLLLILKLTEQRQYKLTVIIVSELFF